MNSELGVQNTDFLRMNSDLPKKNSDLELRTPMFYKLTPPSFKKTQTSELIASIFYKLNSITELKALIVIFSIPLVMRIEFKGMLLTQNAK